MIARIFLALALVPAAAAAQTSGSARTPKTQGVRVGLGIGGELGTLAVPSSAGAPKSTSSPKPVILGTQAASQAVRAASQAKAPPRQPKTAQAQSPPSSSHAPQILRRALTPRFRVAVPRIEGQIPKLSTKTPGLLIVVADLSHSMRRPFAGHKGIRKADALADVVNSTLYEFVDRMNVGGEIKPRLDVILRGYHHAGDQSLLAGALARRDVVTLPELGDNPLDEIDIDDGEGRSVPQPIWVSPLANERRGTPMKQTFAGLRSIVAGWKRRPAEPHLVLGVHVTDGRSTDGDPLPEIAALARDVKQRGGQLLMTNIHLSSKGSLDQAVVFPNEEDAAHFNEAGRMLFEASSPVPPLLAERFGTKPGARMMAYNAKPSDFALVFEAGSSVAAQ